MALTMFRSFRSTITPFLSRRWNAALNLLVDPVTGAPVGIQSPNDNGADGIWTPLDISAAQVTNPTAAMMADLNATYRLNVPPYTRYQSNGLDIVALSGANIQGPGGLLGVMIAYAPVTITDPAGVSIQGTVSVRNLP